MSGPYQRKRVNVFPQGGGDSKRQKRGNVEFEEDIELMNDGSDTSSRSSQRGRQSRDRHSNVIVLDSDDDSGTSRSPITRSRANRSRDEWGIERQQQNARRRQMEEKKLTIDRQLRIEQDLELQRAMEIDRKRKRGGASPGTEDSSSKRVKVERNEGSRHGPPVPAPRESAKSSRESSRGQGRSSGDENSRDAGNSRSESRSSSRPRTKSNGVHFQGSREQAQSKKRKRIEDECGNSENGKRKKEAYLFTFHDEAINAGVSPDQIVAIKMRLPNGMSVQRRFLKADSLYMLFGWAQSELANHQIQYANLRDAKLLRFPADSILATQEGLRETTLEDAGISKPTVFHFSLD